MVVGEAMIVAGIGSRKGVSTAEVIGAVEAALEAHGLAVSALSALATTAFKQEEAAIFAAGSELGLPVVVVEVDALASMTPTSDSSLRQSPLLESAVPPLTCLPASSPRERGEESRHDGFRQSPTLQNESHRHDQPPSSRSRGEGPGRGMRGCSAAASTLTHSELSQTLAGTPSVSEAAALAAAGEGARLCGPRIVVGPVTCALAISGDAA
jgi:cobalt-precorrin 5A hydrolase